MHTLIGVIASSLRADYTPVDQQVPSGPPPLYSPTNASRLWRMRVYDDAIEDVGGVMISEIELRMFPGGDSFANKLLITASNSGTNTDRIEYINDGSNATSYWTGTASLTYPVDIFFDFGPAGDYEINEIFMRGDSFQRLDIPQKFDVDRSDDGVNWTTVWSVDDTTPQNTLTKQYTNPNAPTDPYTAHILVEEMAVYVVVNE